jgi:hypothetical protein
LLPWIELHDTIVVGDVTILPFAEALHQADARAEQLETLAAIYVDGYSLPLAIANGNEVPYLKPAVVFVSDDDDGVRHAQDAIDVLMLSTIFENNPMRANGATFATSQRYLDGEHGFMIDITPTMYGTRMNAIGAEMYLEMKPPRTGPFHHGRRPAMVNALVRALEGPFASELRRLFDTLRTATSESPDVPMDLAESLLAKAAMLVIHQPRLEDRKSPMLARLQKLLGALIEPSTGDEYGFHIARVWQAVRDHRNDFWHPDRRGSNDFPFVQQRLVSPMMLAMRMMHGLLSARLIELGCADSDGDLRADVIGAEDWIGTLNPSLEDGLDLLAAGPKRDLEMHLRAQAAEDNFGRLRSRERLKLGLARSLRKYRETIS